MKNTSIAEALECKEKYDAIKNYCLLSKKNAAMDDDNWAAGFREVKKAQDKVKELLGNDYVTVCIFHGDELIKQFGW